MGGNCSRALHSRVFPTIREPGTGNPAAKRLRMRQVEHFRSLFYVTLSSQSLPRASFCVQLVVQLFCFMLLVFLTIL